MYLMRKSGKSSIKKYSYDETRKYPRDISMIPLSNGNGKIVAIENPMGLPIISWMTSPIHFTNSVIAVNNRYYVDYKNEAGTYPHYCPWEFVCCDDGMQPVVTVHSDERRVYWSMDMNAVSRRFIEDTNVLETITEGDGFRLTSTDFIDGEKEMLVRVFKLENKFDFPCRFTLGHYAPINATGRKISWYNTDWRKYWRNIEPVNTVTYNNDENLYIYTAENSSPWVVGANRIPNVYDCGNKPDVMDNIDFGKSGTPQANGVVDSMLGFDTGMLAPGKSFDVMIAVAPFDENQTENIASVFRNDYISIGDKPDEYISRTLKYWNDWLDSGKLPENATKEELGFIRRLLCHLKTEFMIDGSLCADNYVYPIFFLRDALAPAKAFANYGFSNEAKDILYALLCCVSEKGIQGRYYYDRDSTTKESFRKQDYDETQFPDTENFSQDDPPLILWTIADYFDNFPDDMEFFEKIYPLVKYTVALCEKSLNSDGLVQQNDGYNDDHLQWAFWRGGEDNFLSGKAGIVCCYYNMLWVGSLDRVAKLASRLGKADDAKKYNSLAKGMRDKIEELFWNDELEHYAYFYDPAPAIDLYGNYGQNQPQQSYIAIRDESGGQMVFPDPPLPHGSTAPFWAKYSGGQRAKIALETVKKATEPLRDTFDLLKERADRSTVYHHYIYSLCLAGDPAAKDNIQWLLKATPLAGAPERYPTNRSGVQSWPTADALLVMDAYLTKFGSGNE